MTWPPDLAPPARTEREPDLADDFVSEALLEVLRWGVYLAIAAGGFAVLATL